MSLIKVYLGIRGWTIMGSVQNKLKLYYYNKVRINFSQGFLKCVEIPHLLSPSLSLCALLPSRLSPKKNHRPNPARRRMKW
jgi:hypothetical protein